MARGLDAFGDEVDVWAPAADLAALEDPGISVHRLPGRFGFAALRRLDADLAVAPPGKLLIQYVPQAFGWKGMNLPFCLWLYARRRRAPIVMFHEVMTPLERGLPVRHNLVGAMSCLMAAIVARAAAQIFVAAPIWQEILATRVKVRRLAWWLPLPSLVPVLEDKTGVDVVRYRYVPEGGILAGHFTSFPATTRQLLLKLLPAALKAIPSLTVMLIGIGSEDCRGELATCVPQIAGRIHATGPLPLDELSRHISACDLMIQPYPDGACARRTTLIAALAHGRAIVTNTSRATESLWKESGAVTIADDASDEAFCRRVIELAADPCLRARYAHAAATLYRERFELRHAIGMLRGERCGSS
jgi:glycosyltransferase involved in cell wall biosynthesis